MSSIWNTALNLLYPPRCCGCDASSTTYEFCELCISALPVPQAPLCPTCGTPFATRTSADNHPCEPCLRRPPGFRRARAVATYDASDNRANPLKAALQRYKYGHDVSLAPAIAKLLRDRSPLSLQDYDVVIPVPLHAQRLRWRGFNQALLLARHLRSQQPVPIDAFSLQRRRPTRPQVELDHHQRRHNVAGAFAVSERAFLKDKRILLVDDVYTTGATVNECSRELVRAGASFVDVLVVARAVLR